MKKIFLLYEKKLSLLVKNVKFTCLFVSVRIYKYVCEKNEVTNRNDHSFPVVLR